MIIGKPPFETNDVKTTYKRIKANVYTFPEGVAITEHAKALIRRILHTVPEARPSLDEILQHPFFTDNYTPTSLPNSALQTAPSPQKAFRSSPSLSAPQAKSPSRAPLSERTNTQMNINNQVHQLPVSPRRATAPSHNVPRVSPAKSALSPAKPGMCGITYIAHPFTCYRSGQRGCGRTSP